MTQKRIEKEGDVLTRIGELLKKGRKSWGPEELKEFIALVRRDKDITPVHTTREHYKRNALKAYERFNEEANKKDTPGYNALMNGLEKTFNNTVNPIEAAALRDTRLSKKSIEEKPGEVV